MTAGHGRLYFFLEPFSFPSGGVEVIYRQVEMLVAAGFDAVVALPQPPQQEFFDHQAPVIVHGGNLGVGPKDILVFPEGFVAYLEALRPAPARKYVYCQNQYYVIDSLRDVADYRSLGVHKVIASSEAVARFFHDVFGLDTPIVPPSIDLDLFRPAAVKEDLIAVMPRKMPLIADMIDGVFKRRHPGFADIPWVRIDGVAAAEAAAILGRARWFLALGHCESLGLPPLEAMAAGAIPVGFDGDGGREYAKLDNGIWCPAGDWLACVDGLAEAVTMTRQDPARAADLLAAGQATAQRYGREAMRRALLDFWAGELSAG